MNRDAALDALDIAGALLLLATRAAQAASAINEALRKAKAEDRDITAEELQAARRAREAAYAEWEALQ